MLPLFVGEGFTPPVQLPATTNTPGGINPSPTTFLKRGNHHESPNHPRTPLRLTLAH